MSIRQDKKLLLKLYNYISKYRFILLISLASLLISNYMEVLKPYLLKKAIDEYISVSDFQGFQNIILISLLVLFIAFISSIFFNYIVEYVGQRILLDIRMDMFRKLFRLNRKYFDDHSVGRLLTFITNDVESLKEFLANGVVNILSNFINIIVIVSTMLILNWYLGLITFTSIPAFLIITFLFRGTMQKGYRGVRVANGEINRVLDEGISGIREIKIFNLGNYMIDEMKKANGSYLKSFLTVVKTYSFYFPLIELLSNFVLAAIFLFMHYYMGIHVSVGDLIAYFFYANMIFIPLRDMMEKFNTLQSAIAASERIFKFLDDDQEEQSVLTFDNSIKNFNESIHFENINFSYNGKDEVLKKVSFSVKKGEKIAIIGQTGSGKSTIIKLLTRLYELSDGDIKIGGHSIKATPLKELRKNIINISQKTFLISDSIKNNIKFLNDNISDQKVIDICKELRIIEFIEKFDKGYDEVLGEEGKGLSLGEKQLLSFAKAMVEDKPIVILDEATASVDSYSEQLIERAMDKLLKDKTAIIIAHRLSTIQSVDKIIVFDKGEIVEQGKPKELLSKKDGFYRRFYEIQSVSQK